MAKAGTWVLDAVGLAALENVKDVINKRAECQNESILHIHNVDDAYAQRSTTRIILRWSCCQTHESFTGWRVYLVIFPHRTRPPIKTRRSEAVCADAQDVIIINKP
jgi:hypothetical protein